MAGGTVGGPGPGVELYSLLGIWHRLDPNLSPKFPSLTEGCLDLYHLFMWHYVATQHKLRGMKHVSPTHVLFFNS